jgi:uncharacterized protein (DUF58 family)
VPRPGRRAAGLLLGAAILFAVGTNVQAGWVLAMAALLLGAGVIGLVLPARMVRGVEVERRAPAEAAAGGAAEVDLVVRNRGRRPKLSLLIEDRFVAPVTAFVPVLGPRERIRIATIREPARRGIVEDDPVRLASAAPFGVATARRRVAAGGRTVVHPRIVPLSRLEVLDRPARPEPAERPAPRRGAGQDFLGVREYRTGDSLRHVHWPSTARLGTLIVREFEREEPARLTVFVDTWADAGDDLAEGALDLACAGAASAAVHALAAGALVSVAAGRDGAVEVRSRAGRGELLELLAGLRAPGGVGLDALAEAAEPGDAVLLVAPTWSANAERIPHLVSAIAAEGGRLQVLLVDASGFGRAREPALDAAGMGRLAGAARAAGASVTLAGPEDDLAAALSEAAP